MGKGKEVRLLLALFKEEMTPFEVVDVDEGTDQLIKKDSIVMDEETLALIGEETKTRLKKLIEQFDCMFVKVNEAAGVDAKFLVSQLKCFSVEDVIALVKGSERMMDAYDNEKEGSVLVVKEWYKIQERNEFRCFIVNGELKGISQRYINVFEDYSNEEIDKITQCITDFFSIKVRPKISVITSEIANEHTDQVMIVIDVLYLPKKSKVKAIDIELIYYEDIIKQDKLKLFTSIQELKDLSGSQVDCRYITSEDDSRIAQYEVNSNQFPLELYDTDIHTLINQLNIK